MIRSLRLLAHTGLLAGASLLQGVGLPTLAHAQEHDTIVIAIPALPQGIDPDHDISPQTWTMGAQVFDQGLEWAKVPYPYDDDTPKEFSPNQIPGFQYPNFKEQKIAPGIIESCDLSEDSKTATYNIRKGVKSAWGNEFDADDILWRIDRAMANKALDYFMNTLANTNDIGKWSKIDQYTVQIKSDTPIPIACTMLTNFYFPFYDSDEIKKHVTADDPWGDKWISTNGGGYGAYYVASWEPGRRVVMKANENYWQGVPKIKTIIWLIVPEASSRVALLTQGKVQIAENLAPDDLQSLVGNPNAIPIGVRSNQWIFAVMNNKIAPFDNPKVRQAINMLIPRDDIVKGVFHGLARSWSGIMPTIFPGAAPLTPFDYNVEEAKKLLADSGVDLSKPLTLSFSANDGVQENVAILIQRSLQQAGLKVELRKLPIAAQADLVMSRKGDFSLWVDMAIQPDPSYDIGLMYGTGGATNYANYSNPDVDAVLEKGRVLVGEERIKAHEAVQTTVQQDAPYGWITEQFFTLGVAKSLKGLNWFTCQYYKVNQLEY